MKKNNIYAMSEIESDLDHYIHYTRYIDDQFGLFKAIRDKNYDAVEQLVKYHNHNVNGLAQGHINYHDNPTPLSYAVSHGNASIVRLLIDLGAKIDDKYAKDAARYSRSAAIRKIFKVNCIINYLIQDVKAGNHKRVLKELHSTVTGGETHPRLNEPDDETGDTLLHIAVKRQDLRMIKILMAAAPLLNIKNKEGKLPKDCTTSMNIQRYLIAAEPPVAAWHNDIKQFRSFIEQKIDISKKISVETQAVERLSVSAHSTASFKGNRQILELIFEAESKPRAQWQPGFDFSASNSSSSVSTNISVSSTPSLGLKTLQEKARQLLKDKNYTQAITAYNQLLDVYQKNPGTSHHNKAIAYYGLGFSQFKNQHLQQAVSNLRTAAELEPTNDLYSKKLQECQETLASSQPSWPSHLGCIVS